MRSRHDSLERPSAAATHAARWISDAVVEAETVLRKLRKTLADERGVPAYVIFGDATLRQMAREYPETPDAMHDIFGMGAKKHAEFGELFADAVRAYLRHHGRQTFND